MHYSDGNTHIITTAGLQPAFCLPGTVIEVTSIAGPSPALTQKTPAIVPFSVIPMPKEVSDGPLKEYFAEETFKIISIRVPFNICFCKNHFLVGRAIYLLLAVNSSKTLYLQLCTKYPISSGKDFHNKSGVGTQINVYRLWRSFQILL